MMKGFSIIDMPFSAIGDTVTLPWTLTVQHQHSEKALGGDDLSPLRQSRSEAVASEQTK
jgi:hypothetical protein